VKKERSWTLAEAELERGKRIAADIDGEGFLESGHLENQGSDARDISRS
jgi:hypothetical protein